MMFTRRGRPRHPDILTPREWQVLDLIRQGLSNPRIAERLDITAETAKYHVSEILSKLQVGSREEAAAWRGAPIPAEHRRTGIFALIFGLKAAAVGTSAAAIAAVGVLGYGVIASADGPGDPAAPPSRESLLALEEAQSIIEKAVARADLPGLPQYGPDYGQTTLGDAISYGVFEGADVPMDDLTRVVFLAHYGEFDPDASVTNGQTLCRDMHLIVDAETATVLAHDLSTSPCPAALGDSS